MDSVQGLEVGCAERFRHFSIFLPIIQHDFFAFFVPFSLSYPSDVSSQLFVFLSFCFIPNLFIQTVPFIPQIFITNSSYSLQFFLLTTTSHLALFSH